MVKNIINNSNLNDTSIHHVKWIVSVNGDRLRIGKYLFYKNSNGRFVKMNVYQNFTLVACDQNIAYAIGADSKIWKF